jgi:hypothetical protein
MASGSAWRGRAPMHCRVLSPALARWLACAPDRCSARAAIDASLSTCNRRMTTRLDRG